MKKTTSIALMLICAGMLAAQNAIQWRNDRTGIYHETGLMKTWTTDGPKLLWHYDGLGEGHSSVAVSGNKLYVTGMTDGKGYVYVFDTQGKLLKKVQYGAEWDESYNGTRGTITPNDGKLYLISGRAQIVCLKESDLSVLWRKDFISDFGGTNIQWGICESPLIVGDKLIATPGGKKNNMVALDKNTGALIWSSPGVGEASAYCSPLYIADQQVPLIITMTAKHIIGVDASNGKTLWSFAHVNRTNVHPNVAVYGGDNTVLCTSGYGLGSVMLKLTNGGRSVEKVWDLNKIDSRMGAMVKIGNYAYGSGDMNRYWFCVDWKTGAIKYQANDLPVGNVITNDGMLYCYSDRGDLALVRANPDKFEITGRTKITLGTDQHWAHPVIYKGVLYVRHGNTLMAYKI